MPIDLVLRIPEDHVATHLVLDRARFFDFEARVLIQSLMQHMKRFPKGPDLSLMRAEFDNLKSKDVIASSQRVGRRSPQRAFAEHDLVMVTRPAQGGYFGKACGRPPKTHKRKVTAPAGAVTATISPSDSRGSRDGLSCP